LGIDFRDPANRRTYSDREADASWREAVARLVDPAGAQVVDIGCGGGTYLRAWHDLGAASVTGVDSSSPILEAARESHGHLTGVSFRLGDAADTGLDAVGGPAVATPTGRTISPRSPGAGGARSSTN
jgi:2-polyprenyl-3-methyl-5-hydroxy-6-metoxy-1,4-benzoquinol methylase